jgi:hypothetical protein
MIGRSAARNSLALCGFLTLVTSRVTFPFRQSRIQSDVELLEDHVVQV